MNFREVFKIEREPKLKTKAHKMMDHMHMQMNECHDFMCVSISKFTQKLGCYIDGALPRGGSE
jgi:hypothetical protein